MVAPKSEDCKGGLKTIIVFGRGNERWRRRGLRKDCRRWPVSLPAGCYSEKGVTEVWHRDCACAAVYVCHRISSASEFWLPRRVDGGSRTAAVLLSLRIQAEAQEPLIHAHPAHLIIITGGKHGTYCNCCWQIPRRAS